MGRIVVIGICVILYLFFTNISNSQNRSLRMPENSKGIRNTIVPTPTLRYFVEDFQSRQILEESGDMDISANSNWWVNSGSQFIFSNGTGKTISGELPVGSKWQKSYLDYNPESTDEGVHPQNIFRLVTRSKWKNFNQQVYFRISRYHLSNSIHREGSNGVLLFNRYLDGDTLYYTGIRVDGGAVIKKKLNGVYTTLAYIQIFEGKYHRDSNPNLMPVDTWLGIKSEVVDLPKSKVSIKLWVDFGDGVWNKVLEATDSGKIIKEAGYGGIRSDFMDVEFKDFRIVEKIENNTL